MSGVIPASSLCLVNPATASTTLTVPKDYMRCGKPRIPNDITGSDCSGKRLSRYMVIMRAKRLERNGPRTTQEPDFGMTSQYRGGCSRKGALWKSWGERAGIFWGRLGLGWVKCHSTSLERHLPKRVGSERRYSRGVTSIERTIENSLSTTTSARQQQPGNICTGGTL